jgi:hypothetical protein
VDVDGSERSRKKEGEEEGDGEGCGLLLILMDEMREESNGGGGGDLGRVQIKDGGLLVFGLLFMPHHARIYLSGR